MARLCNVIYASLIRNMLAKDVDEVDRILDGPPNMEEWGMTADAEQGQNAMLAALGGDL